MEETMAKRPRGPKPPQPGGNRPSGAKPPDYEIGYCRSPLHSRFKPGQSGNAGGRPKGPRNLRAIVEGVLRKRIKIKDGDRTRFLSKLEAVVEAIVDAAAHGDAKAPSILLQWMRSARLTDEMPETLGNEAVTTHDVEIVADFLRRHGGSADTAAVPESETDNRQDAPRNEETNK
jgi:hypothetical protein